MRNYVIPLLAVLILLILLPACRDSSDVAVAAQLDSFGLPTRWPGEQPPTWQEWRQWQGELRQQVIPEYRPSFLPDMSRWRPEDFLPATYLEAPMRDVCELPEDEQMTLLRLDAGNPDHLPRVLGYAEQGFVQAMSELGSQFCSFPPDDPALTRREGLEWARRAAASGDPDAMGTLAYCMLSIQLHEDYATADVPPGQLERTGFWFDEMVYWFWRATHNLEPVAVGVIGPSYNSFYFPSLNKHGVKAGEDIAEEYKWLRLNELADTLHGYGSELSFDTSYLLEQRPKTTDAEIAEGERRVREFLRRYGGGLGRARNSGKGCPGPMNFAAFNAEIARYGLHVEPQQPWTPPKYPLPPLPGELRPAE